jgi:3-oxoacyl-[acyl-carrier-protein] synthase-1
VLPRAPANAGACAAAPGEAGDPAPPDAVAELCRQAWRAAAYKLRRRSGQVRAAGSPYNDSNEVAGLAEVFAALPPLVSLKGMIGHTLGAAGAAELALMLECLERGVWPRIDYPLDAEAGAGLARARPAQVRQMLALILGFGGGYAAVAVEDRHG